MSAINQEYHELLEDIQYLEYLVNKDREVFKNDLKTKLSNAVGLDDKAELILDELALFAGKISARAAVIEKNLDIEPGVMSSQALQKAAPVMRDSVQLSIVDVGAHNNLGYVYHTESNMPYCFVPDGKKLVADLYVDRENTLTLAINTPVYSDEKILKDIQVEVDGVALKHKIVNIEGNQRIICHIPKSKSKAKTHLAVIFPVSTNGSAYKLGISDIHCVPRQTLKTYIKKKIG